MKIYNEQPDESGYYTTDQGLLFFNYKLGCFIQDDEPTAVGWWEEEPDDDEEMDDDYNSSEDDDDYDPGYSHTQQTWMDRNDYANELLRDGKIDREQADEIRHGA